MSSEWSQKRGEGEEKAPEESKDGENGGQEPQQQLQGQQPSQQQQASPHQPSPNAGQGQQPPPGQPRGYPPPGTYPYPPVYPPPADGSAPPPYPPPPRGYEGAPPPYGMPPPHGYPMYPYQPPMYPHYPGYPPPMPYGYPPPDPSMVGHGSPPGYPPRDGEHGPNVGPYSAPASAASSPAAKRSRDAGPDRKPAARDSSNQPVSGEDGKQDDSEEQEGIVPGAVTARLKTYIKPRIPSTQDVLDRRSRKNAQSRARASKLRDRIIEIEKNSLNERNDEESEIFAQYEARRQRKNNRSRERALEKKEEIDRILSKPEKKRTKIEKAFLDNALGSKKRKNEGDRLRRHRLKELGLSTKGSGMKPGISARGPLPHKYHPHHMPPHGYPGHMGDIPMSPMPPMAGHHHGMQSPGGFGSPGMMPPNMGYPSPQHAVRPGAAGPGVMETPGRQGNAPGGAPMSYMPHHQNYDAQPPASNQHHYQQQQQQQHSNSRVEQRRHADGSMSIQIGGGAAGGSSFGGETRAPGSEEQASMNISDVSHLLLYDNGEDGEAEQGHAQGGNEQQE